MKYKYVYKIEGSDTTDTFYPESENYDTAGEEFRAHIFDMIDFTIIEEEE